MAQYLLNLTCIWLLSLLVFDLFLRKETFHQYNRVYLWTSLLAGLLIPLWKWNTDGLSYTAPIRESVIQVNNLKQTLQPAAQAVDTHFDVTSLVWAVYLAGLLIWTGLILIECIKLFRYYKQGIHTSDGGIRIVMTGREHSPFSFGKTIFISDKAGYSDQEWNMILHHEKEHLRLAHSADKIILVLLQAIFWFHPLLHMFGRRLQLVHEFQADSIAAEKPADYGRFLMEQTLLQSAPLPAHSFNYSPIKNRITMLTATTSSKRKAMKYLVALPLLSLFAVCFTQTGYSHEKVKKGNKITYRGNEFELSSDNTKFVIKEKGKDIDPPMAIQIEAYPVKMNGEPIYSDSKVSSRPAYTGPSGSLERYVFSKLQPELNQLEDGTYGVMVFNLITDETGNIVYYDLEGIRAISNRPEADLKPVDANLKKRIDLKVTELLDGEAVMFKPARLNNKAVISFADLDMEFRHKITVKDHTATMN